MNRCCSAFAAAICERFFTRFKEREKRIKAGENENLSEASGQPANKKATTPAIHFLPSSEDGAQAGAADVFEAREIEDHVAIGRRDRLMADSFEFRSTFSIDPPGDRHNHHAMGPRRLHRKCHENGFITIVPGLPMFSVFAGVARLLSGSDLFGHREAVAASDLFILHTVHQGAYQVNAEASGAPFGERDIDARWRVG